MLILAGTPSHNHRRPEGLAPWTTRVVLRRVLAVCVDQNIDVGQIHRSAAAAVTCEIVLLDQNGAPIGVEAGELATHAERNKLERLPRIAVPVRPNGRAHRLFDEPAHGRPFPRRTVFEPVEELFVDRDRCSHDASG